MIKKFKVQSGYTIIETMVAISLFLVVVMLGMGSLLNAGLVHKKTQDLRSIMDNMNFIMEDISRNIRTGFDYRCITDGNFDTSTISTPQDCALGGAIAFESTYGDTSRNDNQVVYKIDSTGGTSFNISKSTDSGATFVQLNPQEISLTSFSGFSVLGSAHKASGDSQQPFVTIKLVGNINYKDTVTTFSIQTSVSQRRIDI